MTAPTPVAAGSDVLAASPDAETPIADDQADVVATEASAVRVTAPAGSGKTRTMVEWAADRASRLDPGGDRAVLAVTFTVRAAGELQARIASALRRRGLPVGLARVTTLHGLAASIITEHGHRIGVPANARLIGAADQSAVVEAALDSADFAEMDASFLPHVLGAVTQLASNLADHGLDPVDVTRWHQEVLVRYEENRAAVESLRTKKERNRCETARKACAERLDVLDGVQRYRQRKASLDLLDYGDQLRLAVALLGIPDVSADLRRRFPYLVVDEYQDTNVAQRQMLQHLHEPSTGQLVVVGDDAQAIYAFRGATLDNFDRFGDHFSGAVDAALHNVYRHGPEIVAAAESVASKASGWRPRRTVTDRGSALHLAELPDQQTESEWVADHVAGLIAGGAEGRDVAVLAGQRRVLLPIARLLEASGIAVEAPGLGGLLDSPILHEVLAVLRLAHDPGDAVAAARLLRGPRYRLGPHQIAPYAEVAEALARHERETADLDWRDDVGVRLLDGLVAAAETSEPELRRRVELFLGDLRRWVSRSRMVPLGSFVEEAVADLGLGDALATNPAPGAVRARSELAATLEEVRAYESADPKGDLAGFLSWIDRRLDVDDDIDVASPDPGTDAVRMLTIHAAKGLQFRHVVVAGVAAGILPNTSITGCETMPSGRSSVPDDLREDRTEPSPPLWDHGAVAAHEQRRRQEIDDEQRRLFYVAATRAVESLAVTGSRWGWTAKFDPAKGNARSLPYLEELESEGFTVERPAGPPPDENPLEPLPLLEPPELWEARPLEEAVRSGRGLDDLAAEAGADPAALDAIRKLAAALRQREPAPAPPAPPAEHTVTDLVLAARCPVAYSRRRVMGLPQPTSSAARRGTLVHRWIEERAWALQEGRDPSLVTRPWRAGLLDPLSRPPGGARSAAGPAASVDPDAGSEGPTDDPAQPIAHDQEADAAAERFVTGPYGERVPWGVEVPVVLTVAGSHIRGTIDAVYASGDPATEGTWEIVDVKTGPAPDDEAGWRQLEAYALAVSDSERWPLERGTLTFLSLAGNGEVISRPAPHRDTILDGLRSALDRTTGPYDCPGCRHCH